jgi:adenylate cyclase
MPLPNLQPPIPFVGRDEELLKLHEALRSTLANRRPTLVLIQGDFGVGKTALVEQFLSDILRGNRNMLIGQGRCSMENELSGLTPFSQLLTSLTQEAFQQRVLSGSFAEFIKEVAPAWIDIFTGGVVGAVITTIEESKKLLGGGEFRQENVFLQFTNALRRLADKRPIVAFIDDLHWADASSLRLLFHLARNLGEYPLLFLCLFRSVEAFETSTNVEIFREVYGNLMRYGALEIDLRQGISVAAYVMRRYPLNHFSARLIEEVQTETEGHALFVSQLFTLWEETGVITSAPSPDGRPVWGLARAAEALPKIPSSMSSVLEERLRLMEAELREVLNTAAVEGVDFTAQVIARLAELDEMRTIDDLDTLAQAYKLVESEDSANVTIAAVDFYRFVHRFFREYVYSKLSPAKRRLLHLRVGETLEALYENRSHIAAQLALHFDTAREPFKAATYALLAAKVEQTHYTWAEGERWCEKGLAWVAKRPRDPQMRRLQLDLLEQSAHGYQSAGQDALADQRYRAALALAEELIVEPELIVNLCSKLVFICDSENRLDEAIAFLAHGKQILVDYHVPFGEPHIKLEVLTGLVEMRQGQNEVAVETLQRTIEEASKLPQTHALQDAIAKAYNWLGVALSNLSSLDATTAFETAIAIAAGIGERALAATYLLNLADDYVYQGKLNESEARLAQADELAREIGDEGSKAYVRATRGRIFIERGQAEKAVGELSQAIAESDELGQAWNMPWMHADLALAYVALGQLDLALEQAKKGITYAEGNHFAFGYAHDALARVEAARQNWDAANKHFNSAITTLQELGDRAFAAQVQCRYAQTLLLQNRRGEAIELFRAVLETFDDLKLQEEVIAIRHLLAEQVDRR